MPFQTPASLVLGATLFLLGCTRQESATAGQTELSAAAKGAYNRATTLAVQGRFEEALAAFDESIRLDSRIHRAHYNRALTLEKLGRHEDAAAAYARAIQLEPTDHKAHLNMGTCLEQVGQRQQAIQAYREAIRIKPDYASAHNNLGLALIAEKRAPEAR